MTRLLRVLFPLALVALATACGSSGTPTASATPVPATSASASATPSADSTGCSQTAATSSGPSFSGDPAGLVLATTELPANPSGNDQTWTQIADGLLNGQAGTHQRGWQNSDNTQRIEIDIAVQSSVSAAASGWPTWCKTIQSKLSITRSPQCPSNMTSACITNTGTTSDHSSESVFTWQDGSLLVALLYINGNGPIDESYSGDIAVTQDKKIAAAS